MSRDWRLYWDDIVSAAEKVASYTRGMNARRFAADERTRDAVLHNLQIIGEAAKRIPVEQQQRASGVSDDIPKSRDLAPVNAPGPRSPTVMTMLSFSTAPMSCRPNQLSGERHFRAGGRIETLII